MIRHIVHLRFRDEITPAEKRALFSRLADLRGRVDGILDFQVRRNVSVEPPLIHGFLDMFWFDFSDASARDGYLVDDVHQAIGGDILAAVDGGPEGILVCDIEL